MNLQKIGELQGKLILAKTLEAKEHYQKLIEKELKK